MANKENNIKEKKRVQYLHLWSFFYTHKLKTFFLLGSKCIRCFTSYFLYFLLKLKILSSMFTFYPSRIDRMSTVVGSNFICSHMDNQPIVPLLFIVQSVLSQSARPRLFYIKLSYMSGSDFGFPLIMDIYVIKYSATSCLMLIHFRKLIQPHYSMFGGTFLQLNFGVQVKFLGQRPVCF